MLANQGAILAESEIPLYWQHLLHGAACLLWCKNLIDPRKHGKGMEKRSNCCCEER